MNQIEIEEFAYGLAIARLEGFEYISVAEAYYDETGEFLPPEIGDEVMRLITGAEVWI